jgi:hypothetical protein
MAIDRRPNTDRRKERALSRHATIGLADGISISLFNGSYSLVLATNSGLSKSTGLKIILDTTSGLTIGAGGLKVLLGSTPGLSLASGLVVLLDTNPGLVLGAGGLKVLLDTNPGLVIGAGGLKTLLDGDSLVLGASGLKVKLDGNSGLTISTGLKVLLDSNSGLSLSATGIKVSGPAFQTTELANSATATPTAIWTLVAGANDTWYFEATLLSLGSATSGLILNVTGPTGSTCALVIDGTTTGATVRSMEDLIGSSATPGLTTATTYSIFAANSAITIKGQFKTNGTAGNFVLSFVTSLDSNEVKILAGSYANAWKV